MEAKDTIRLCPLTTGGWGVNCDPKCHKAQAEISFKAGIREVVEWIEANDQAGLNDTIYFLRKTLQAQIKKWGL